MKSGKALMKAVLEMFETVAYFYLFVYRDFVSRLPWQFQEIGVLVNNTGLVKGVDKVGSIKEEDIDTMIATNLNGLINTTQAVLAVMKKRGDSSTHESGRGDIINIGSIAGREGYPGT